MSVTCPVSIPARLAALSRPSSLSRHGATALAIRVSGAGGMLLSHIVLMRCLGVEGFGEYAQAITWLQLFCVFGKLGLDNTSLRFVAEYQTLGDSGQLRRYVRESAQASMIISLFVTLFVVVLVRTFWNQIGVNLAPCMIITAMMIPLVSLRQIQEAGLRGAGRMVESQISNVIGPLLLFLLATIFWLTSPMAILSPDATVLHLASVFCVSSIVYYFFRRCYPASGSVSKLESHRQRWVATAFVFFLAELLIALKGRFCVAMAGATLGSDSAGLYAAMERFADVAILGNQSLGLVIAPQFASLFAAGRYADMRRLMRKGQLLCMAMTIPVAIGIACFSDWLFVVLGKDYQQGWSVLLALLASACLASYAGPAAYVLQMSGRERTVLSITGLCAITNIFFSLILVRPLGLMGFGISQIVTSLLWVICVRTSLSWHPAWERGVVDPDLASVPTESGVSP